MDRVPPTKKTDIEKLDEQLAEESEEWAKLGMHGNMTVHPPESLWVLKMQVQSIMNVLLKSGLSTEEDIQVEFKTLMLADMKNMRKQIEQQRREAIVPKVEEIAVPGIKLLGKDGKPIKL